jgi:hypothetical protein
MSFALTILCSRITFCLIRRESNLLHDRRMMARKRILRPQFTIGIGHCDRSGDASFGHSRPARWTFAIRGRCDREVSVFDTATGHLTHRIAVGIEPHGLCVWPQPGRYALGHTGDMR